MRLTNRRTSQRMSARFIGTFFKTKTPSGKLASNGVHVRREGIPSEKGYEYVIYYSDYITCSIMGVYQPGQDAVKKCRLLVAPQFMADCQCTPCEEMFSQLCGKLLMKYCGSGRQ
ncbi:uncharacterized protein LOC144100553 [Amblyomma americanum]